MDRGEIRQLQDKAIKAIRLLFPNCANLDSWRVTTDGPTVAEARDYLYPEEYGWIWRYWIEEAQKAGHDLQTGKRKLNKAGGREMRIEEAQKLNGVVEVKKAGVYAVLVVEPGSCDYVGLPDRIIVNGQTRPVYVIDKHSETHKRGWMRLNITDFK